MRRSIAKLSFGPKQLVEALRGFHRAGDVCAGLDGRIGDQPRGGMAVPDWPNSYGYNMFFFPVSKWIGGIFFEHTHRLVASRSVS